MKKNEIYQNLRQAIISGHLKAGDRLPMEYDLAKSCGVARGTLRLALQLLEEDGYLERVKSKGTFIRLPSVEPGHHLIYFLVPCAEYLRYYALHNQHILFELITSAASLGWRVSPVIFSRTNRNTDIWWENLSSFGPDSRIVVNRHWFEPYFETLVALGARVAFIHNGAEKRSAIAQKCASLWQNFIEDDEHGVFKALQLLHSRGCQHPAVALPHLDIPDNAVQRACHKYAHLTGDIPILVNLSGAKQTNDQASIIASAYRHEHFDGILIHCDERALPRRVSLRSALGLPENLPMVAIPMYQDTPYMAPEEDIPILEYPIQAMTRDIVQALAAPQYIPFQHRYCPQLILPNSNSHTLNKEFENVCS